MPCLTSGAKLRTGPVGPLRDRCALCSVERTGLILCSGCRAVRYCSRAHQDEHQPSHKPVCNGIESDRESLAYWERMICKQKGDVKSDCQAIEIHVDHHTELLDVFKYIRYRFILANHLRFIGTPDGVREAADHMLDMLRMNRGDYMFVQHFIPAALLRLDRDQDAYDFMKWCSTLVEDDNYDWGAVSEPFMNLKDEDVLEDPNFVMPRFPRISHLACMLLLKMKLLVDIRGIKTTRCILARNSPLPPELILAIAHDVVRSPIAKARLVRKPSSHLNTIEVKLVRQVARLGRAICDDDYNFFTFLCDPDEALAMHPERFSSYFFDYSSVMQRAYSAIRETAGVLEILKATRLVVKRDWEDKVVDMLEDIRKHEKAGHERTEAELLYDVSLDRIWDYLDWAVQDASYPGRWSNRPSERYIKRRREWAAKEEAEKERAEMGRDTDEEDDDDDEEKRQRCDNGEK
ncbi:uncharacterized protein SPSK_07533 [Sporothrix schenckii 1099-18]|uniref:MYND-type domain-containing protein n=1 Tax=Sporothrix schenckii 1099-18 TaxID=1397361 RepID=A0A0F2MEL8_SPOSC|nr:uncharacterized protein SPSK_07533 [Sporothrix schenckii 1099-18]KJR88128.1 hypothetical protein SPSK_07533 [Sporothrix schenckii 1099-18]